MHVLVLQFGKFQAILAFLDTEMENWQLWKKNLALILENAAKLLQQL